MAQDQGGLTSGWATVSFSCADAPPATAVLDDTDAGTPVPPPPAGGGTFLPPAAILDLRVIPSLVRQGDTTKVNWSAQNVQSCTVRGDNGDQWTGLQSPIGGQTSKSITAETAYTLTCKDLSGQTVTKQAKVNILPGFREL